MEKNNKKWGKKLKKITFVKNHYYLLKRSQPLEVTEIPSNFCGEKKKIQQNEILDSENLLFKSKDKLNIYLKLLSKKVDHSKVLDN